MSGGYVIQVGNPKPAEAIIATPNKRGEPVGEQMTTYKRVGAHLILNTATVWGRRIIRGDDGKVAKTVGVEFNTTGYQGEIEFLDWGIDGGCALAIRYLPQSRSLDLEYQNNVQKLIIRDDQLTHIALQAGENKFDYKKDDLYIKFLKVIPANQGSRSKNPNPDIKGHSYWEVTEEHVDKKTIERIDASTNAAGKVKEISVKPEQIRNLFVILGKREEFGSTDSLSGDGQIYKTLLEYAYGFPDDFFYLIEEYKNKVRDAFDKAESYKALDLTKDGHIAIELNQKKQLPFSSVEIKGKGNAMIEWVLDHYLESEVFKGTQIFLEQVSKLK